MAIGVQHGRRIAATSESFARRLGRSVPWKKLWNKVSEATSGSWIAFCSGRRLLP